MQDGKKDRGKGHKKEEMKEVKRQGWKEGRKGRGRTNELLGAGKTKA